MDSTSLILTCLAAGLTALCVYYHIKVFSFWSSRGVKGPTPWPLMGTSVYYIFRNKIELDEEWSRKYGKVYGIYEGYHPSLRVTDNELLRHIYIKECMRSFTDRNTKLVKGDNMSRWIFFARGEHWYNQRTLMTPMFTSSKLKLMFPTLTCCVNRFMEEVDEKIKRSQFVTKNDLMFLTMDIISKCFFGLNIDTYRDKSNKFCEKAFAFAEFDIGWGIFYMALPSFIRDYFKLDLLRPFKYEYFDRLSDSILKKRRKAMESGELIKKPQDFIQLMIDATIPKDSVGDIYSEQDALDSEYNNQMKLDELEEAYRKQQSSEKHKFRKFNDLDIRADMTFFFIAGFETSSNSLDFALYELSHRQDLQAQIYTEVDSIRETFDYDHLMELRTLNAFISESFRLYNPVTEHNRVVTNKEGVWLPSEPPLFLPYDTTISVPGFVVHRDPDYWPEPDKFDLSRFYPENKDKIKSSSYMPFGLGPRNCVGMRFALMSLKAAFALLVLNYRISPAPENKYPPNFKQHQFFSQLNNNELLFERR